MRSSIGHLHVRYRGLGALGAAGVPQVRSIVQDEVMAELETCLERALEDDRSVYVVRRVHCELTVGGMPRAATARRAATSFARSIVKTIVDGESEDVIRFESEAVYLGRFLTDLLRGDAWGHWYYGPLRSFQAMPVPEAVDRILREHRDAVPQLLAHLHGAGVVGDLVERLGAGRLRSLVEPLADAPASPMSARPVFAAVIPMYEAIAPKRSAWEYEAAFDNWTMAHGEAIDWQSRASLTGAAASMLTALVAEADVAPRVDAATLEAALSSADWLDAHVLRELLSRLAGPGRGAIERVLAVLTQLGAIDRTLTSERLVTSIVAEGCTEVSDVLRSLRRRGLTVSGGSGTSVERLSGAGVGHHHLPAWIAALEGDASPTVEAPRRLTPELEALLGDLRDAVREVGPAFRGGAGDQVRLFAALVHRTPHWADRASVVASALERIASTPAGALTQAEREIAQALDGADASAPSTAGGIETASAGIFLLLRAVADARLAHLAQAHRYPAGDRPFASLLTSLAVHWSEPGDPAASLLIENAPSLAELRADWGATSREAHAAFQAAVLRLLSAQRLMGVGLLRVQIVGEGHAAIVLGGCDVPGLWPFASPLLDRAPDAIVSDWVERWESATGVRPETAYEPAAAESTVTAWRALAASGIGITDADVALTSLAHSVMRLWARWLRQFAGSGASYLVEQFIRRRGLVVASGSEIVVHMERKPLDLVLEMAGYDRDLDPIPGVFGRRVRFRWQS